MFSERIRLGAQELEAKAGNRRTGMAQRAWRPEGLRPTRPLNSSICSRVDRPMFPWFPWKPAGGPL